MKLVKAKTAILELFDERPRMSSKQIYFYLRGRFTEGTLRNELSELHHKDKVLVITGWAQQAKGGYTSPIYKVRKSPLDIDIERPIGRNHDPKHIRERANRAYRLRSKKANEYPKLIAKVRELEAEVERLNTIIERQGSSESASLHCT